MAASGSGGVSTVQKSDINTIRVPCVGSLLNRSASSTKDQRFVNGYFDVTKNQLTGSDHYYFVKRDGLQFYSQPSGGTAVGRGCYSWNGNLYSVFGNQIYSGTTNLGVTMSTSTGMCYFAEVRPAAEDVYLGINDGTNLYLINMSNSVTTISTIPANIGSLTYMDGYFFTMDINGTIYNCAVDDPTSWTPVTNYIYPMMYGGVGKGLAHQGNLLLGFTDQSVQMFDDAANATGTPLANVDYAVQQIGAVSQGSIAHNEATVFWVGNSKSGGWTVYMLTGLTNISEISTPGIQRVLGTEGINIMNSYGFLFRHCGNFMYCLNLVGTNRTFIYNPLTDLWVEWSSPVGGRWTIVAITQYNDTLICQDGTTGNLYKLTPQVYQDNGVNFNVQWRSARMDFDTEQYKFVKSLSIIGDQQTTTAPCQVSWYDDDYNTQTIWGNVDLSLDRPLAVKLGSFRRRAFQLDYSQNLPFRMEAVELRVRAGL